MSPRCRQHRPEEAVAPWPGGMLTFRGDRARGDSGGGRSCKRESTWGHRTSARSCERAAVQALPCKHTSVRPTKPRVCERAVPPKAQRPPVRRAHVQLCKSVRERWGVLLARLQLRASTHAHTRACLRLCKCAGVSFATPKRTDGCTTVVSGDGKTRCHRLPAVPPPPVHCPGGLSTDTLITRTGLQIAFAGLRKC